MEPEPQSVVLSLKFDNSFFGILFYICADKEGGVTFGTPNLSRKAIKHAILARYESVVCPKPTELQKAAETWFYCCFSCQRHYAN